MDCGFELLRARSDVLLLLLVIGPEQEVVYDHLQACGAADHHDADLTDGGTGAF